LHALPRADVNLKRAVFLCGRDEALAPSRPLVVASGLRCGVEEMHHGHGGSRTAPLLQPQVPEFSVGARAPGYPGCSHFFSNA